MKTSIDQSNPLARVSLFTVVIPSGGTESESIRIAGGSVSAVLFPAAMTGASVTFEASFNGNDWFPINGVSVTVNTGEASPIDPTAVYAWPFIRVVSASAEGADRTIKVVVKEL